MIATPSAAFAIGTPVYGPNGVGYVSRLIEPETQTFTLAGGMRPVRQEIEIVFDGRLSVVPDGIAAPWLTRAIQCGLPAIPESEVESRRSAAIEAQNKSRAGAMSARDESQRLDAAFKIEAVAKTPAWAKAVIVAELIQDKSDSMSDYYGSTTRETVILAFSAHARDLFPELRKAAANCADCAHLADAPEKAEHREKYSMGAGFYLKNGSRDSDGWRVRKYRLYQGSDSVPRGKWALQSPPAPKSPAPRAAAPALAASGRFAIVETVHTKHGWPMWIATLSERVERSAYEAMLSAAKGLGGWYSRQWGESPAGFAFKREASALAFVAQFQDGPDRAPTQAAPREPAPQVNRADKLRALADRMDSEIAGKLADRLTNTPKRQREAMSQRLDGYRLERTQKALRALADCHDSGTVPPELSAISTKAAAFDLVRAEIINSGGYYDAGHESGRPALSSPAALTIWAMISDRGEDRRKADALRVKIQGLQFANIPGFFPTPAALVAQMIDAADIPDGCRVLEPSAGSGAILDGIKAAHPGCDLVAFERHHTLRHILMAKGYELAGDDFTESDPDALSVDRVLMNPPFENGQDMEHVRRAFRHLRPGGRLVAIMSPGPFFRQDAKAEAFREWFDAMGGEKTDIPAGAFKESGTEVASVMVEIREGA